MKNLSVFGSKLFFFIGALLRKTRESICSSIGLALAIVDSEMILTIAQY